MTIKETVAVEALKLSKWAIAIIVSVITISALLPEILPRVTKASVFGTIELELIEQKLIEAKEQTGKEFDGTPEDLRKLLEESSSKLKGQKFLWIDNEPANNTAIRNLLEEAGVVFEITVSGKRAERLLQRKKYSLVISDSGRGQGIPTGVEDYLQWKNELTLPPFFFYSASHGNSQVSGAVLSTNNAYTLLNKAINTAVSNSTLDSPVQNNKVFSVPIWFYIISCTSLVLAIFFVFWVILNSSESSTDSHKK